MGPIVVGIVAVLGLVVGGGLLVDALGPDAARPARVAAPSVAVGDADAVVHSLVASGEPHLETPFPIVASAVRVDGVWRVARRYACGLAALAGSACKLPVALPTTMAPAAPGPSTSTSTSTTTTTSGTTPTTAAPVMSTTQP